MKSVWTRTICRLLVALMIWTPFHIAQAGMIGTDQVATAAQAGSNAAADRGTVLSYLSRGEVSSQLQALGIDPSTAQARVAAMSDLEVQGLAQRIQSMPAGASDAGAILLLLVVIGAVWWFFFRK
jgi:hypothetical protein